MAKIKCSYKQLVDPKSLTNHPRNNNKHSKEQLERLAKLIEYHGWRHPIVVSNLSKRIVFGHARCEVAILKGWDKVPVDYQDFDSKTDEYTALTADNEIARWAKLDEAALVKDLEELNLGDDFDIELLGIEDFSLLIEDEILDDKPELNEDKPFVIEVQFPNDMEMMEHHDDLLSQGYIVRIK